MAVCPRCDAIDLENVRFYLLANVETVIANAENGCRGCDFVIRVARKEGINLEGKRSAYVVLHRLVISVHQVELLFLDQFHDDMTEEGLWDYQRGDNWASLRLCSTYGVERSLTYDIEADADDLPGRLVSVYPDDEECLSIARAWFQRCTRTHGDACALKIDAALPTRLIHVPLDPSAPLRLRVTEGMRGQYVTLSYVWGTGTRFRTTSETLASRMQGFRLDELPRTLQDAVKITRLMGFEYLWVDALCIIQGDIDDWTHESALMARVYGNAIFTISADNAADTDAGILRPRSLPRSHAFGSHGQLCLQSLEEPWRNIATQHVYQRGWAFQERVLSVRVLHFMRDQIAWECNTTLYREPLHGRENRPLNHFGKNEFTKPLHLKPNVVTQSEILSYLHTWNSMVQEVAIRHFTVPTDRLPGISGIASAIEIPELGNYFAGVWERHPFLSMGWHPWHSQRPPIKYRAPTWSWVWTTWHILSYSETWAPTTSAEVLHEWEDWEENWGPRLLADRAILLASAHSKGDVLEGTYITISGYCCTIWVEEQEGIAYDVWGFCGNMGTSNNYGSKVHMDWRENGWDDRVYFSHRELEAKSKRAEDMRRYLCVQILRERKHRDFNPKAIALILSEDEIEGGTFRRTGVLAFDFLGNDDGIWSKKTLKLV